MPQAVRLLARQNFFRHVPEQLLKTRPVGMIYWKILQHPNQPGHDPAVAAAPEDLFAVRLALLKESAVTEKKMLVLVVEIIRLAPPVRHGKIKITPVVRGSINSHPCGRPHEQSIAPGPILSRAAFAPREVQI